jgi:drug/metabolite transporter (DMT)-like permease
LVARLTALKHQMNAPVWSPVFPVIAALFWAGNYVLGRLAVEMATPVAVSFWRWTLAFLIALPFAGRSLWVQRAVLLRHSRLVFIGGFLNIALFSWITYTALTTTTAVNASLIVACLPLMVALLSWFTMHEKPLRRQIVAIAVSLTGVTIIIFKGDLSALRALQFVSGDLLMLLAVMAFAIYSLLLRFVPGEISPITFMTATMPIGILVLAPFYIREVAEGGVGTISPTLLTYLLLFALFPSLGAYTAWSVGVARFGPTGAGQYIHLVPAFGVLLAMLVLGEQLHVYHAVGVFFIAIGLALAPAKRPSGHSR